MKIDGRSLEQWLIDANHTQRFSNRVGGSSISDGLIQFMMSKMEEPQIKTYLEIGTFDGVSLSLLAEKFPNKQFIAVDAFSAATNTSGGHLGYFIENNKNFSNVELFIGDSKQIMPSLSYIHPDIIFIDGDHGYSHVRSDLFWSLNYASHGAIIMLHDYNMEGVKRACDIFCAENSLELKSIVDVVYIVKG